MSEKPRLQSMFIVLENGKPAVIKHSKVWDCSVEKIGDATHISLISFDIYQMKLDGPWVNCHGTYPVYVKANHEPLKEK
jgi:hypothetical protein